MSYYLVVFGSHDSDRVSVVAIPAANKLEAVTKVSASITADWYEAYDE